MALLDLGIGSITALSDGTPVANACNLLFEEVVKEVSSEGAFSSTIRRATLNLTANTPEFDFSYEFQLPTNPLCLRVLAPDDYTADWVVEGDKLLAHQGTLKIKYIAYLTNSGEYDEMLKQAIVAKLAYKLAKPFTGASASELQSLYEKYQVVLRQAKATDGKQGKTKKLNSDSLTKVR